MPWTKANDTSDISQISGVGIASASPKVLIRRKSGQNLWKSAWGDFFEIRPNEDVRIKTNLPIFALLLSSTCCLGDERAKISSDASSRNSFFLSIANVIKQITTCKMNVKICRYQIKLVGRLWTTHQLNKAKNRVLLSIIASSNSFKKNRQIYNIDINVFAKKTHNGNQTSG